MQLIKCFSKLIFSSLVLAFTFAAFSVSAFAQIPFMPDPISGAMAGSMAASGFSMTGATGISALDGSGLFSSSSDPVPWDSISHKSAKVSSQDSSTYRVELSPTISTAGERRTEYINHAYGLSPGSTYNFGSYYSYHGYTFAFKRDNSNYEFFGHSLGDPNSDPPVTYRIDSDAFVTFTQHASGVRYRNYLQTFGNASNSGYAQVNNSNEVVFVISTQSNPPKFAFALTNSSNPSHFQTRFTILNPGETSLTTYSPSLSRSDDSSIIDPQGRKNYIDVPKSYLQGISFDEDEDITDDDTLKEILTQILQAFLSGGIIGSGYIDDPGPVPPSTDTVSETLWTDFTDFFNEHFGDIYDDLHAFKESFGDWVDDVAAGWTEVFGDIYDTLVGWQESFGDFADTITSAISDIVDAVSDIVESIKEGDFEFIDGFWKNFQAPFMPFFNTIKQHLGIWHYVVEWLGSISSAFTFFFGVMSNTGYNFILPIYAAFAGTVVLAVYKRFGK